MKPYSLLCLACAALLWAYPAYGQANAGADITGQAATTYSVAAGDYSILFNGFTQFPLEKNIQSVFLLPKGHRDKSLFTVNTVTSPRLVSDTYGDGNLVYNGIEYRGVRLRLDIHRDELMVLTPNMLYGVVLEPERFGSAEFHGYRLVYNDPAKTGIALPSGYYMELYSSNRYRILEKESYTYNNINLVFTSHSVKYYILDGDKAHAVKSKNALLKLLGSHKKELKEYIRRHYLDFRNDMENAIVYTVAEYERLTK